MKPIPRIASLAAALIGLACATGVAVAQSPAGPQPTASVYDSAIYRDLFSTAEMREVFSDKALVAHWLRFEVTLALVQAQLEVIPQEAAQAIAQAAVPANIDMDELRKRTMSVGRPIEPLLAQVVKAGGKSVADSLHLGGTTQDVLDTGTVLQIKQALAIVQRDLRTLILRIAALAKQHRATPMVARTNGQDALPTTFGMLLASYMTELQRDAVRLEAVKHRVLVGQYGSAVGTLSAAGPSGLKVRAELMKRLGLGEPDLSWNASRDTFAELVQVLGLVHGVFERIASDVNLWSRTADNQINEGVGGASSTMPQKRNPRASEFLGGLARTAYARAGGAYAMLGQSETRQGAPWISEWPTIPEMFLLTAKSLEQANTLFEKLIVRPETMSERFNDSKGYVMAEAVMSCIEPKTGRGEAYRLVKEAIKAAPEGASLREAILRQPKLLELAGRDHLDAVLDPRKYLGLAPEMVDAAVARVEAANK